MNLDKKKKIIIGVIGAVLFLGIVISWLFWWGKGSSTQADDPAGDTTEEQVKPVLADDKKPRIELDINTDRSGGVLTISEIDEDFVKVEYELIYLAESEGRPIERGVAGGPIDVPQSRTIRENILFGTESCTTGVCHRRIDQNVSSGTVIIRVFNDQNQSWSIDREFEIEQTATGFTSVWTD